MWPAWVANLKSRIGRKLSSIDPAELIGDNAYDFVRRHRWFTVLGVLGVAAGLAHVVFNGPLRTPIAPGGHGSLQQANTPAKARAIVHSWRSPESWQVKGAEPVSFFNIKGNAVPKVALAACAALDIAAAVCYCWMLGIAVGIHAGKADRWVRMALAGVAAGTVVMNILVCLLFHKGASGSWVATAVFVVWLCFWARIAVVAASALWALWKHRDAQSQKHIKASVSELGRTINWTAFGFFLVVVVCLGVWPFNQVHEALRVTCDPQRELWGWWVFWLFFGTFLFSGSAWYLSRALIVSVLESSRTRTALTERGGSKEHLDYWGTGIPALYAVLPFATLGDHLRRAAEELVRGAGVSAELQSHHSNMQWAGLWAFAAAIGMAGLAWVYTWRLGPVQGDRSQRRSSWSGTKRLGRFTIGIAVVAVVIYLGIALGGAPSGYMWTPRIGALGTLMFGLAGINAVGTGLNWLRVRWGSPLITGLQLWAAWLTWYGINDNHTVRLLPGPPSRAATTVAALASGKIKPAKAAPQEEPAEDPFDAAFQQWLRTRPNHKTYGTESETPYPVVLVAAEGGGIRAASEAALTLAYLEDQIPGFRHHVFAVSGVSGGSVGLGVYAGLCRETQGETKSRGSGWWVENSRKVLEADLLAPTAAALTGGDLIQDFWPHPVSYFDRAAALEKAFERAWPEPLRTNGNPLEAPFEEFHPFQRGKDGNNGVPGLFFNTTRVETGDRLVLATIAAPRVLQGSNKGDERRLTTLEQISPDVSVRLSTAAFLSARFTYVSPSGGIPVYDSRSVEAGKPVQTGQKRVVDGGYFENSGAATLLDILRALHRYRQQDHAGWDMRFRVLVLRIGFHYDEERTDHPPNKPLSFDELLAPPVTLYNTRDGRARVAVAQLRSELEAMKQEEIALDKDARAPRSRFVDVRFVQERDRATLPFGWLISPAADLELMRQIECGAFPGVYPDLLDDTVRKFLERWQE